MYKEGVYEEKGDINHTEGDMIDSVGATNRTYKDTIFADLFSDDADAEDNVISLFNALYGTNYKKGSVDYKKEKLENTLRVTKLKNDVSFMLDDKLLVLLEHQSTVNENMPLRCMFYCVEFFKRIVKDDDVFKRNMIKLPMPQFFVFYNGNTNYKADCTLKLSDAFITSDKDGTSEKIIKRSGTYLELTIRMININHEKNHELLKKCKIMDEYSQFTELIKKKGLKFKPQNVVESFEEQEERERENLKKIKEVVEHCIKNNILKEYFERKGGEVNFMLLKQYSEEYEIECTKRAFERYEENEKQYKEQIKQKDRLLEEKDQALEKKDQALEEKNQALEEKDQALEEKDQALEKKNQALEEKDQALEEQRREKELLQKKLFNIELFEIISLYKFGVDKSMIMQNIEYTRPYFDDILEFIDKNEDVTPNDVYNEIIKKQVDNGDVDNSDVDNSDINNSGIEE